MAGAWTDQSDLSGGQGAITDFGKITLQGRGRWGMVSVCMVECAEKLQQHLRWASCICKTDRKFQVQCSIHSHRSLTVGLPLRVSVLGKFCSYSSNHPWMPCSRCLLKLFYLFTWAQDGKSGLRHIPVQTDFVRFFTLSPLTIYTAPPKSSWLK